MRSPLTPPTSWRECRIVLVGLCLAARADSQTLRRGARRAPPAASQVCFGTCASKTPLSAQRVARSRRNPRGFCDARVARAYYRCVCAKPGGERAERAFITCLYLRPIRTRPSVFFCFSPTNSDLFPKRRNQPIPFGGNPYSNGRAFSSLLLRKLNSLSLPPRLVQGFTARVAYRFRFFTMSSKTSVLAVLVVVFAAFPAVKAACGQLSGGACNVGSSKTMCSSVNSVGYKYTVDGGTHDDNMKVRTQICVKIVTLIHPREIYESCGCARVLRRK